MKCLITLLFFFVPGTYTYPQSIEHPLPATVDVWGLANKDSVVFAGTEIGFQQTGSVFRLTDFEVSWDTLTGLPSGVYFYQLRAGEFVETKKMVLLR